MLWVSEDEDLFQGALPEEPQTQLIPYVMAQWMQTPSMLGSQPLALKSHQRMLELGRETPCPAKSLTRGKVFKDLECNSLVGIGSVFDLSSFNFYEDLMFEENEKQYL